MDKATALEIITCLPKGRTLFHYFKDRYALLLLSYAVGESLKISALRNTAYAKLLHKPLVRELLATTGDGVLTASALLNHWLYDSQTFVLSLTTWGDKRARERRWYQTSRCGHNIVLQLNFSQQHEYHYRRLIKPTVADTFSFDLHPVLQPGQRKLFRDTLAWARIDLDFAHNEALIEEIQSDWVRYASRAARWAQHHKQRGCGQERCDVYGIGGSNDAVLQYTQQILQPYVVIWREAMLIATIQFIRNELGLQRIYYHDFETGNALKGLNYGKPPRSLYSELPRQFCFKRVQEVPVFLQQDKTTRRVLKKIKAPYFFKLNLQECSDAATQKSSCPRADYAQRRCTPKIKDG